MQTLALLVKEHRHKRFINQEKLAQEQNHLLINFKQVVKKGMNM